MTATKFGECDGLGDCGNAYYRAESDYKRPRPPPTNKIKSTWPPTMPSRQGPGRRPVPAGHRSGPGRRNLPAGPGAVQAIHRSPWPRRWTITPARAEGVDPDTAETDLQNAEQQAADDYQQNMAKPTGDHEKALAQADLDFSNNTARDDAAWSRDLDHRHRRRRSRPTPTPRPTVIKRWPTIRHPMRRPWTGSRRRTWPTSWR